MINFDELKNRLSKYNQEHLVKYWNELSDSEKKLLCSDIEELNLDEIQEFFKRATASLAENGEKLDDRLQPIPDNKLLSISRSDAAVLRDYEEEGLRQISECHVGVLLMAGGQGTRLGFAHPKGMFNVGLPSGKTLFQIQAERIRTLQRLAKEFTGKSGNIAWYIMTSEHTMMPTIEFFEKHNHFGLEKNNIVFFEQGSLPCFDFDGKILLDEKHRVSKAPDGNGGLYRALRDQGILADMKNRGVLYLHAHSVDNILIKVADPIFIGYCVNEKAECAAKVVEKSHPNEAVGVVCIVDGKYQVVEYSEITSKTAEMRRDDGRLTFSAGNICNHYFSVDFLNKIADTFERELKLHVAQKKIPHIDEATGNRVTPDKPNGIKIEKFVFDVFEFSNAFVTVEVARDEEFSALKNADSACKDCPSTARNDIFNLHKKFLERAGGHLEGSECEISPLLSYAGEGIKSIVNGKEYQSPIHLRSDEESLNGHL